MKIILIKLLHFESSIENVKILLSDIEDNMQTINYKNKKILQDKLSIIYNKASDLQRYLCHCIEEITEGKYE